MQNHEYTLLGGVNRSLIGRYLGSVAAILSSFIVFIFLYFIDLAKNFGLPVNVPPAVLSLLGAGAVFGILYWVFDRYLWRFSKIGALLKLPDLGGAWTCKGVSLDSDGNPQYTWEGKIIIVQTWDRIRVRLTTTNSGSNSVTAALVFDEADGYQLIYNYRNDPKIDQPRLKSHLGFSRITFSPDLNSAAGEYFNGYGRFTFGKMEWAKSNG